MRDMHAACCWFQSHARWSCLIHIGHDACNWDMTATRFQFQSRACRARWSWLILTEQEASWEQVFDPGTSCFVYQLHAQVHSWFVPLMIELGSTLADIQWTGSTPAGFHAAFLCGVAWTWDMTHSYVRLNLFMWDVNSFIWDRTHAGPDSFIWTHDAFIWDRTRTSFQFEVALVDHDSFICDMTAFIWDTNYSHGTWLTYMGFGWATHWIETWILLVSTFKIALVDNESFICDMTSFIWDMTAFIWDMNHSHGHDSFTWDMNQRHIQLRHEFYSFPNLKIALVDHDSFICHMYSFI